MCGSAKIAEANINGVTGLEEIEQFDCLRLGRSRLPVFSNHKGARVDGEHNVRSSIGRDKEGILVHAFYGASHCFVSSERRRGKKDDSDKTACEQSASRHCNHGRLHSLENPGHTTQVNWAT